MQQHIEIKEFDGVTTLEIHTGLLPYQSIYRMNHEPNGDRVHPVELCMHISMAYMVYNMRIQDWNNV